MSKPQRSHGTPARGSGRITPLIGLMIAVGSVVALFAGFLYFSHGQSSGAGMTDKPAPLFALDSTAGKRISLDSYKGKQDVILYWYEHAG